MRRYRLPGQLAALPGQLAIVRVSALVGRLSDSENTNSPDRVVPARLGRWCRGCAVPEELLGEQPPVLLVAPLPCRGMSCPGLCAHPQRCIIQPDDGLIQVIRWVLDGAADVPARTAASAICGEYAW